MSEIKAIDDKTTVIFNDIIELCKPYILKEFPMHFKVGDMNDMSPINLYLNPEWMTWLTHTFSFEGRFICTRSECN